MLPVDFHQRVVNLESSLEMQAKTVNEAELVGPISELMGLYSVS